MTNCINNRGQWSQPSSGYCTVVLHAGKEYAASVQGRNLDYLIVAVMLPILLLALCAGNILYNLLSFYHDNFWWPEALVWMLFAATAAFFRWFLGPRIQAKSHDNRAKVDAIRAYFSLDYGTAANLRDQIEGREWSLNEQVIPEWAMKKRLRGTPQLKTLLELVHP